MTLKTEIDHLIDDFPDLPHIVVDCSPIGGRRIFGPNPYRGRELEFIGESRATKKRKEAEREREFKEAQTDAFKQRDSESNKGP